MNGYNDKGEKHGPCEKYYSNGKSDYKANFVNGNTNGLSEDYNYEGNLLRKQFFL